LDALPVGADVPEEYAFLIRREKRPAVLNFGGVLDEMFFAPHLTPKTLATFLDLCRKKRYLDEADRPLVLKNPADFYFNFWNIHQMLPQAKFIFIHRHPLTMLNSYPHSFQALLTKRSSYAALLHPGYGGLFSTLSLRRRLLLKLFGSSAMSRLLVDRI